MQIQKSKEDTCPYSEGEGVISVFEDDGTCQPILTSDNLCCDWCELLDSIEKIIEATQEFQTTLSELNLETLEGRGGEKVDSLDRLGIKILEMNAKNLENYGKDVLGRLEEDKGSE